MMRGLATRLLGLLLFVLFCGAAVYNWNLLINYGYYYPKLAGLAPFGALGSLIMVINPGWAGRPDPADTGFKVVVIIVTVMGLILGGANYYLMSNYRP